MRSKRRDAPRCALQNRSRHEALKSLGEICHIAQQRDISTLDALSKRELNVLLATLNHIRVDLEEEGAFTEFFLEVVDRIRRCSQK